MAIDLVGILLGRLEIARDARITALSPLRSSEVVITEGELKALRCISDLRWDVLEDVCAREGLDPNLFLGLAQEGLILLKAAEDDDALGQITSGLNEWNKYAVLYHFMNKWRDMHLRIELPREPERLREIMSIPDSVFEQFVNEHGLPPPAFKTAEQPKLKQDLPLVVKSEELYTVLSQRKTTRAFDPKGSVSLEDFSTIAYYGFGCHGYTPVFRDIIGLKKTSPSGGCLHPVEAYSLVMNVDSVAPGLYHYNVENHRLDAQQLMTTDDAREMANVFTAGQSFPRWCSALFIMTARFYRNHWKYRNHPRSYAVLYMDAAHISQTLYLVCAELGIGAFFTAAVNGANIEDQLGLNGLDEGALAIFGCGIEARLSEDINPEFLPFIPRETEVSDRADSKDT